MKTCGNCSSRVGNKCYSIRATTAAGKSKRLSMPVMESAEGCRFWEPIRRVDIKRNNADSPKLDNGVSKQ